MQIAPCCLCKHFCETALQATSRVAHLPNTFNTFKRFALLGASAQRKKVRVACKKGKSTAPKHCEFFLYKQQQEDEVNLNHLIYFYGYVAFHDIPSTVLCRYAFRINCKFSTLRCSKQLTVTRKWKTLAKCKVPPSMLERSTVPTAVHRTHPHALCITPY